MSDTHDLKDFSHTLAPHLGKRLLRIGVAGNYGLRTADIHHAAQRGVNFWIWTPTFKQVTPALKSILHNDRAGHAVAMLDVAYSAGMVRRGVERALRRLGVEQLDIYLLSWLGRGSFFTAGIQEMLARLREEGKIAIAGTSIHDRKRAGRLAQASMLDAFMLRYNAKHPGAEQDVFPHLARRQPLVIAYTATSWRQLLQPMPGIEMPPWPSRADAPAKAEHPYPPLSPELCYRFCLTSKHVHVTLTGPKTRAQLDQNLDALAAGPLSPDEEAWVRAYGRKVKAKRRLPFV